MTRSLWIGLALLCVAGFFMLARRSSESSSEEQLREAERRSRHEDGSLEDSIDWDVLNKAEDEVRDVDPRANPEDGFEGDDWGPGTTKQPPVT